MNYLTKKEARDKIVDEITDYILSKAPDRLRELYTKSLNGLGKTVYGFLKYLHRFIKEETGKLEENPLRGDAEHAFHSLFSIIKYLVELSTQWELSQ